MKTIKIIDLLNKIANGEEVPKKIKWGDHNLTWCVYEHKALDELGDPNIFECAGGNISSRLLNDKVEIIEDIPKVQVGMTHEEFFEYLDRKLDTPKENNKIEKLDKEYAFINQVSKDVAQGWTQNELIILDKLDEIIERLNGEDNE